MSNTSAYYSSLPWLFLHVCKKYRNRMRLTSWTYVILVPLINQKCLHSFSSPKNWDYYSCSIPTEANYYIGLNLEAWFEFFMSIVPLIRPVCVLDISPICKGAWPTFTKASVVVNANVDPEADPTGLQQRFFCRAKISFKIYMPRHKKNSIFIPNSCPFCILLKDTLRAR